MGIFGGKNENFKVAITNDERSLCDEHCAEFAFTDVEGDEIRVKGCIEERVKFEMVRHFMNHRRG